MLRKCFEIIKSILQWIRKQYFFHFLVWIYWVLCLYVLVAEGSPTDDFIEFSIVYMPLISVFLSVYSLPIILIVMLIKYISSKTVCVTSAFLLHNKVYGFCYWITIPTVLVCAISVYQ